MSRSGISYEKEESSESDTGESEITEIKFKEEMSKEEEEEVIMSNIDRPKLVRIWAAEREGTGLEAIITKLDGLYNDEKKQYHFFEEFFNLTRALPRW